MYRVVRTQNEWQLEIEQTYRWGCHTKRFEAFAAIAKSGRNRDPLPDVICLVQKIMVRCRIEAMLGGGYPLQKSLYSIRSHHAISTSFQYQDRDLLCTRSKDISWVTWGAGEGRSGSRMVEGLYWSTRHRYLNSLFEACYSQKWNQTRKYDSRNHILYRT